MAGFFSLPQGPMILLVAVLAAGVAAFLLSIILLLSHIRLKRRLAPLFDGKQAGDLEQIILAQRTSIAGLDRDIQELYAISNRLYRLSQTSLHRTDILRFNPFREVGGNHSFAIAFLDGYNNGFVLSSLHTREGTRMYAKPVENGHETAAFPLTEEERRVVASAVRRYAESAADKQ